MVSNTDYEERLYKDLLYIRSWRSRRKIPCVIRNKKLKADNGKLAELAMNVGSGKYRSSLLFEMNEIYPTYGFLDLIVGLNDSPSKNVILTIGFNPKNVLNSNRLKNVLVSFFGSSNTDIEIEIMPHNNKPNEYDAKFYLKRREVRDHIFTITDIPAMTSFRERYMKEHFPVMVTHMMDKLKSYSEFGTDIAERINVNVNYLKDRYHLKRKRSY